MFTESMFSAWPQLCYEPSYFIALIGLIGLMIGSFLNVVIYRLPLMMAHAWRKDCLAYLNQAPDPSAKQDSFNLALPSSHCPHCQHTIALHHNIPVVSYLLLKGRCAYCAHPISPRYLGVEVLTGLCSMLVAYQFGCSTHTGFILLFTWILISLIFIDIDQQLLPDTITLALLWLGLILSASSVLINPTDSILGAAFGYLILWLVFKLFKLFTGKEGMGYGDFKLLAALGAWLGWHNLPMIILLASLTGSIIGLSFVFASKHNYSEPIPFGPYLAIAGWVTMLWGESLQTMYAHLTGLPL
jgi:leader peptidase (prepilin peptidase)/N-methyltransferase